MARDPYRLPADRRPTDQLRREDIEPAPETRRALADDAPTMARCPCCAGAGMVPHEVALVIEGMMVEIGERR